MSIHIHRYIVAVGWDKKVSVFPVRLHPPSFNGLLTYVYISTALIHDMIHDMIHEMTRIAGCDGHDPRGVQATEGLERNYSTHNNSLSHRSITISLHLR